MRLRVSDPSAKHGFEMCQHNFSSQIAMDKEVILW